MLLRDITLVMKIPTNQVIKISKNGVSIGAHPSFNDPENFEGKE